MAEVDVKVERRRDYPKIYEKLETIENAVVEIKTIQEKKVLADISDLKKDLRGNGKDGVLQKVDMHDADIKTICKNMDKQSEEKKATSIILWGFAASLLTVVVSGFVALMIFWGNFRVLQNVVLNMAKKQGIVYETEKNEVPEILQKN